MSESYRSIVDVWCGAAGNGILALVAVPPAGAVGPRSFSSRAKQLKTVDKTRDIHLNTAEKVVDGINQEFDQAIK
jgi:hypothetical protein